MASTIYNFGCSLPLLAFKLEKRVNFRSSIRCLAGRDSTSALSSNPGEVNGAVDVVSSVVNEVSKRASLDSGNGYLNANFEVGKREENLQEEKLEPLWDDGYGSQTVKDYLDYAKEMIKPDGGPVRWFTPIACGPHLEDSPVLLFLPGMDGLGHGLILHHKSLGKVFDVRCMHIPVQDRTPFEELVRWVEKTVRSEHLSRPNKPIYLVGDSLGGCLALAVAARNPDVDLVLILSNPATSFGRSQLQPLLPLLAALPNELHATIPYILSFVMGEPLKMATVDIKTMLPPSQYLEQLANNLTSLLPRLSGLSDIIPKETLLWKLKLLRTASAYANSRLHAVKAEVLVLASGKDNMLPSRDEAWRLLKLLKNCNIRYFKDNGHTILLEDGVNLLTIIKGTCTYRRSRKYDSVYDFIPPSMSEYKKVETTTGFLKQWASAVILSTMEDGTIVRGLAGVPSEGPVLLVGYHMLMGLEVTSLVVQFLTEKKIIVRGMAHPALFSHLVESRDKEFSISDSVKVYGAVPVTPANLFKLLEKKSHVLLYPGGAREALHRKGEEYKLFWPDQPEFVRMAARFGATIVPFGVVGEDDLLELVLDHDELLNIPILGDQIRGSMKNSTSGSSLIIPFPISNCRKKKAILYLIQPSSSRAGMSGEVAKQNLNPPVLVPKIPGRLYYLFGKPIETRGKSEMLKDREKAKQLYLQIKSQVEANMMYLLEKRKKDPYRFLAGRAVYQALDASRDQVPAFEL